MLVLKDWVHHDNHNVRRLVSEGTRPRLPWASKLNEFIKDPSVPLAFLEILKEDESKYVQKSVANHLNDITKDHLELVISTLEDWNNTSNKNTKWIIKHALRNELKKGNEKALKIMGFEPNLKIKLSNFKIEKKEVTIGMKQGFSFSLMLDENNEKDQYDLMIDYNIHYMKANGNLAPKTFKLATKTLKKGEELCIHKTQSFKIISTRKLHPGKHLIEIQINGKCIASKEFMLL